jgi:sigma-B regulation protein RsbU (phosphoserine phosphatase)
LLRYFVAILFAACATTYSILWIVQIKHSTPQPGFTNYDYSAATGSMTVGDVVPGSAAERAGLRPGDRIVALNGQKLGTLRPFYEAIVVDQNEILELTVEDPRSPSGQRELQLPVHGGKRVPRRTMELKDLLGLPVDYYPVGFLVVGVAVLLLRTDDANAWLLALLFGGFLAVAPLFEGTIPPLLRGFVVFYKIVMSWSGLALFYYFFAMFPSQSPVDRKIPWLKYVLLAGALFTTVPIGLRCLFAGGTLPLYLGVHWPGADLFRWVLALQTGLPTPAPRGWPSPGGVFYWSFIGAIALGLVSLISNSFLSMDAQVRRKAQVMVWGTVVGTAPIMCLVSGIAFFGGFVRVPMAFWQISVMFLSILWPMSFAYAVVKHRVLEIPLLLKRSARYVLVQRGYVVFLLAAGAIAITLFTHTISRFLPEGSNVGMTVSAVFGIVLVWVSAPVVKRGTERIDRAFFRSAYDARVILQDLAEKARTVTDRDELARLLESKIAGALHPKSLACYLKSEDGLLVAQSGLADQGSETNSAALPRPHFPRRFGVVFIPERRDTIPADLPLLHELAQRGKAWDVPQGPDASGGLTPLTPECLVPILGRDSRLIGLLVLGQRLSEEPYSGEDKSLLDSVASQAGITLENIRLAERIAERIEAERRATMEMDFARRVQARLFPQKLPPLKTLDYLGGCVQARQVGGDYYDFLEMEPGVVGIVLADISGKGMSGALLMATCRQICAASTRWG